MSDWQPIETAPKDGTKILVGRDGHQTTTGVWVEDKGRTLVPDLNEPYWEKFDHSWWDVVFSEDEWFSPTHWMPLPEPPK